MEQPKKKPVVKKQTNPKLNRRSHSNNATFASVPISK